MYKQCRTEQSAARQALVEQCLLRDLEVKHYEDISVNDLCRESGVSRKSFYRYFSGKSGVLHALLDRTIQSMDISMTPDIFEDRRTWLTQFFRFWKENRAMLDLLQRSQLLEELVNRMVDVNLIEYVGRAADMPTDVAEYSSYQMEFLLTGMMRVMLRWYRNGFRQTPEQMASAIDGVFPR